MTCVQMCVFLKDRQSPRLSLRYDDLTSRSPGLAEVTRIEEREKGPFPIGEYRGRLHRFTLILFGLRERRGTRGS